MPNESVKPKASLTDKVDSIIAKQELHKQVEIWQEIGDRIHKRLEYNRIELTNLQNKLPKKEE